MNNVIESAFFVLLVLASGNQLSQIIKNVRKVMDTDVRTMAETVKALQSFTRETEEIVRAIQDLRRR